MPADISYDDALLMQLMENSASYEEFRMNCDLHDIECIVSRNEFDKFHHVQHYFSSHPIPAGIIL